MRYILKVKEGPSLDSVIDDLNISNAIKLDNLNRIIADTDDDAELQTWIDNQQHVSILVGGADGLSTSIKNKADEVWSLSKMTLPHNLVRIVIIEQIYRAWSIINRHPYHRE